MADIVNHAGNPLGMFLHPMVFRTITLFCWLSLLESVLTGHILCWISKSINIQLHVSISCVDPRKTLDFHCHSASL